MKPHLSEWRTANELALGGLFIALGILLPIPAHIIMPGKAGSVLLPMHLPPLICAMFVSPWIALMVGLLTPQLSFAFTGMPPFPFSLIMSIEIGALCFTASLLNQMKLPVWLTALLAVIVRIMVTFMLISQLGVWLKLEAVGTKAALASIITGLPGVAIQVVSVPIIVFAMKRLSRPFRTDAVNNDDV